MLQRTQGARAYLLQTAQVCGQAGLGAPLQLGVGQHIRLRLQSLQLLCHPGRDLQGRGRSQWEQSVSDTIAQEGICDTMQRSSTTRGALLRPLGAGMMLRQQRMRGRGTNGKVLDRLCRVVPARCALEAQRALLAAPQAPTQETLHTAQAQVSTHP